MTRVNACFPAAICHRVARQTMWVASVCLLAVAFGVVPAFAQLPDPALMHGRPIPAADLPSGTVTVRVVRQELANNIQGQEVTLALSGTMRTAITDAEGRAEFSGLAGGTNLVASATVDGEELRSQPFNMPANGGVRLILVAGLDAAAAGAGPGAAAAPATPAVPGQVIISGNSRILMEFQNDALAIFYLLEVVNTESSPVDMGGPLIIDLPTGAAGAGVLEGSTQNASVSGETVTVLGPFAPGTTHVQVAFTLRHDSSRLTIEQPWRVPVEALMVGIERLGDVSMASPQFESVNERRAENGTPFLVGITPAMAAGTALTLQLSGLPAHSPVPRYVALVLAAVILAAGAWLAFGGRGHDAQARQRLIARRDSLLGELAALESRHRRAATPDPRYASRRQRLLSELEQIYGELDEAGPQGGGEGVAA